jgi:DNA-binding NarL/FixJ family response regulator
VLQLLADGHAIKDIAASLDISPKNVEYHKYRIMDLLGIKTTAELVRYAVQQGLVTR